MRTIRRLATSAAALCLTAAAIVGSTGVGPAGATGPISPTTPGPHSYSFTLAADGSTQSTGTLQWDNTTWALTITATTGQLASGSCVTVYYDWLATGHHDARALRDCTSNDTYSYSFPDANTSNLTGGPSRMGVCYGADDKTGTCTYYSVVSLPTLPMDWTPWPQPTWANPCVLSWTKRAADATVSTFIDPHPQRRAPAGSTC